MSRSNRCARASVRSFASSDFATSDRPDQRRALAPRNPRAVYAFFGCLAVAHADGAAAMAHTLSPREPVRIRSANSTDARRDNVREEVSS